MLHKAVKQWCKSPWKEGAREEGTVWICNKTIGFNCKNIPVCELLLNTHKLTKFVFAQHENRTYVGQREVRTYLKE